MSIPISSPVRNDFQRLRLDRIAGLVRDGLVRDGLVRDGLVRDGLAIIEIGLTLC
jgi:hypothetical protein